MGVCGNDLKGLILLNGNGEEAVLESIEPSMIQQGGITLNLSLIPSGKFFPLTNYYLADMGIGEDRILAGYFKPPTGKGIFRHVLGEVKDCQSNRKIIEKIREKSNV